MSSYISKFLLNYILLFYDNKGKMPIEMSINAIAKWNNGQIQFFSFEFQSMCVINFY